MARAIAHIMALVLWSLTNYTQVVHGLWILLSCGAKDVGQTLDSASIRDLEQGVAAGLETYNGIVHVWPFEVFRSHTKSTVSSCRSDTSSLNSADNRTRRNRLFHFALQRNGVWGHPSLLRSQVLSVCAQFAQLIWYTYPNLFIYYLAQILPNICCVRRVKNLRFSTTTATWTMRWIGSTQIGHLVSPSSTCPANVRRRFLWLLSSERRCELYV